MKTMLLARSTKKNLTQGLILFTAIGFAYSNIFSGEFLLDDEFLLQKNKLLQSWDTFFDIFRLSSTGGAGGIDNFYRPLQTISYLIFSQIFGFSTETFHSLNLILHLLNAVLIWRLAPRLGFSETAGWWGALLWGVHPIHNEAVTYMSATADPLHTMFCLLGLFVALPDFSTKRIFAALPLFVLALLSKEPAIIFPALICVCIYFKNEHPCRLKLYLGTWPLWIAALSYLVLRRTHLDFDSTYEFYKTSNIYTENIDYRILTFLATVPRYIALLVWPHELHLERTFPVHVEFSREPVLGLLFCVFCSLLLIFERSKYPKTFSFAVLWVAVTYVVQSGILIPVNAFFLEHWMYLVSIGPFLTLNEFALRNLPNSLTKNIFYGFVSSLALYWAIYTYRQNKIWESPITFYRYILEVEPLPQARIFNNLGMAYEESGRIDEAQQSYEKAIALSDSYPQTHHNLALVFIKKGDLESARIHFEKAIEMRANFYYSYPYLAEIYRIKGDFAREREYLKKYQEILKEFDR